MAKVKPITADDPATPAAPSGHRALRIMVVDDNETLTQTLMMMIEVLGHDVCAAHSGQDALDIAMTYRPDVIFLDIGMPDMNGFDVCRRLRTMADFKNITIIAQTGWDQPKHREEIAAAGFNLHLVKPATIEMIEVVLEDSQHQLSPINN